MYYSFGLEAGLETLVALSKPYAPDRRIGSEEALKAAYHLFLKSYQPTIEAPSGNILEFVTDPSKIGHLASFFRVKSLLNDKNQGAMIEGQFEDVLERIGGLERGFGEMNSVDPEFASFFRLAINYVFCASSTLAGGGTTSSALGVIWAAHRNNWERADILEFFVHELTHNMVFLDECRFRHYPDYSSLSLKENYVQSAILSVPRPLDKTVHSLMVAAEILMFRDRLGGHPKDPVLHPSTGVLLAKAKASLRSIGEMQNFERLTTPRVRAVIGRVGEVIHELAQKLEANHELDSAPGFVSVAI